MIPYINLGSLPKPDVIESIDYEDLLTHYLDYFRALDPDFIQVIESDPAYKLIEVAAYREVILRQRVNDAANACMLAYATGADLDNLGILFDVQRLVIDPGDPTAVPPVPPVLESDEFFRQRIIQSNRQRNTTGCIDDYLFFAKSADPRVKSVSVLSVQKSLVVDVYILSTEAGGVPSAGLLAIVDKALSAKTVRPLSDLVKVHAANIKTFNVTAQLTLFDGVIAAEVLAAARKSLDAFIEEFSRLGRDLTIDNFHAALHVGGVYKVNLTDPSASIINDEKSAAVVGTINLTVVP